MHRLVAPLFLVALIAPAAAAQDEQLRPLQFDVSAFGGYQLNGDATANGGTLNIADAPTFGAALDWRVHPAAAVELMWAYTNPDATFRSNNPLYPSSTAFGVPTHYFQLGGMAMRQVERVEAYLGLTAGAALLLPETIDLSTGGTRNVSSTWRFAMTLMAGAKIWLTNNVGLRLETRLLMPILFNGGGYYYGSGGSGLAVSAGIPSLQLAFTGGLVFGK